MWTWFHRLASPPFFYRWTGLLAPWLFAVSIILLLTGAIWGLAFVPPDYQQGNSFRIIYFHVPVAILSLTIYMAMAVSAAISLIWRIKLADVFSACCAPIGAAYTFLALVTGSIWGKPTWGVWWDWDARMTSELVLFFLYCGVISIRGAMNDAAQGGRAAAILAIVGAINVPIIHYSVEWWESLHQGATITRLDGPTIHGSMASPLFIMLVAYFLFWISTALLASRVELLDREQNKRWVREALAAK